MGCANASGVTPTEDFVWLEAHALLISQQIDGNRDSNLLNARRNARSSSAERPLKREVATFGERQGDVDSRLLAGNDVHASLGDPLR